MKAPQANTNIWELSNNWAVSRDPYNWILLHKSGKSWKKSYYASPEQMLKALHIKLTRTEPAQPDLLKHLQACLDVAQEFSRRFYSLGGEGCPQKQPKAVNARNQKTAR